MSYSFDDAADIPPGDIQPTTLRAVRAFDRSERPEVLVHVDGDWHAAQLNQWLQDPAGDFWADVTWRRSAAQTFERTIPRQRVWVHDDALAPDHR